MHQGRTSPARRRSSGDDRGRGLRRRGGFSETSSACRGAQQDADRERREAAIVDASAGTMQSWQQAVPLLNQMAGTLRIEAARAPAPLTAGPGARWRGSTGMKGEVRDTWPT